jgi:hypothetical protein
MPLTTVDQGLLSTNAQYTGFKNRLINGDMVINQRAFNGVVPDSSSTYTLDRWELVETGSMAFSVQQSSTAPAGFTNSVLITTTTAASPASGSRSQFEQYIEGFNIADLAWGTATASPVTLSFWVRSSLTGQFGGSLSNSANSRSYPFAYTISAANTFEYKTITIPGDTTGTWLTNNGRGICLHFDLGMGSSLLGTAGAWAASDFRGATGDVRLSETNGATFFLTGVQLERGQTATSFDVLPYGTELALCQRYCVRYGGNQLYEHVGQGNAYLSSAVTFEIILPTTMRTTPSLTPSGNWFVQDGITNTSVTSFGLASGGAESSPYILAGIAFTAGGLTVFRPYVVNANNSLASSIIVSAEL